MTTMAFYSCRTLPSPPSLHPFRRPVFPLPVPQIRVIRQRGAINGVKHSMEATNSPSTVHPAGEGASVSGREPPSTRHILFPVLGFGAIRAIPHYNLSNGGGGSYRDPT
ncbi:hypothetical protein Vretimale_18453 [Volvox reticuliferus]|uniref:Uncharacterized protein n=1 Tax=Volvox reticuliferus TaxID=1737510 RepID=A0A8J4CZM2_9CHLO|nr:hypothetical protein Vretifemale_19823 [Volvox reticuliferus]GIM15711.1 hypothetical protein Vretimale_18453 [Volvox reticuliferus]